MINEKINNIINLKIENNKNSLINLIDKLELVNPLNILKRGFSLTTKDDKIIKSVKNVNKSDILDIRLNDGVIKAKVEEVNYEIWSKIRKIRKFSCGIRE